MQAVAVNACVKIQDNASLHTSMPYDSSGQIEIINAPLKEGHLLISHKEDQADKLVQSMIFRTQISSTQG